MKKATKIMGAVLGVLLVAALFTGAAAAADNEYNLGDVYLWKLYEEPLGGVWTGEDGATAEMVLDDVTGEWYFSGNNTELGTYTYSEGLITYKITIKEPSATVYGLIYKDSPVAVNELIGNSVDTGKIISFKDVNASGLVFTNPEGTLTSEYLVGAVTVDTNPVYQALVQEAEAELDDAELVYTIAEADYKESGAAIDLINNLDSTDLLTVKEFVLQLLEDYGYKSSAVYTAIKDNLPDNAPLEDIQGESAGAVTAAMRTDVAAETKAYNIIMGITADDLKKTTPKAYALTLPKVQASTDVKKAINVLAPVAPATEVTLAQVQAASTAALAASVDHLAYVEVQQFDPADIPVGTEPVDAVIANPTIVASETISNILKDIKASTPHISLASIKVNVQKMYKDVETDADAAVQAIVEGTSYKLTDWTPMEKATVLITGAGLGTTGVWTSIVAGLTPSATLKEIQDLTKAKYPECAKDAGADNIEANDNLVALLTEADVSVKAQVLSLLEKEGLVNNTVYDTIEAVPALPILELPAIKVEAAIGYGIAEANYYAADAAYDAAFYNWLAVSSQTYTDLSNVEIGEWTVQGYFTPSTAAYDEEAPYINGYTGFASLAPKMMFGKEYTFNVIKGDSTTSLAKSTDEAVTQGGYVSVTITAPGYEKYKVEVDKEGTIPDGQTGVITELTPIYDLDGKLVKTTAKVSVGATGTATFVVKSETTDNIKVTLYKADGSVDKTLTIKVKAGEINVDQDLVASTYIGNEVKITGTNDLSGNLTAFIKGPNFDFADIPEGAILKFPIGKEWELKIDTGKLAKADGKKPDAGNYTVYIAKLTDAGKALIKLLEPKDLDNKDYCFAYTTAVVALKQPFINITEFPDVVVKGEKLVIKGTAEGQPKNVQWYIFGTNFFDSGFASVDDDSVFEITYSVPKEDNDMQANQYFAVVQHPMYDKDFNVGPVSKGFNLGYDIVKNTDGSYLTGGQVIFNTNARQSANAAQALCDALDDQNIDDMYVKKSFFVAGPSSVIGNIPEQVVKGEKLTISGVAIGHKNEVVSVDLLSTAFAAVPKETVGSASFTSATARIGEDGLWTVTIDTSDLNADDYTVSVAVGQLSPASSKIKIVNGTVPTPTTQPTTQPTTAPTAQPTQTPASPGFGILAALAGLGAVAVLLLRRQ